jgi:hypothetical protein
MVCKSYIEKNLRRLNYLYNHPQSTQDSLFYAKLAIMELCGWIEVSMDDIILRLAKKNLSEATNITYIKTEIIKRTYGFEYDRHILPMIEAVIGRSGIEHFHKTINAPIFLQFTGALTALKTPRNQHAHEYIKNVTLSIDAPSVTFVKFSFIYAGLKEIERVLL